MDRIPTPILSKADTLVGSQPVLHMEHLEYHQKKTLENENLQWRKILPGNPLTLFLFLW